MSGRPKYIRKIVKQRLKGTNEPFNKTLQWIVAANR